MGSREAKINEARSKQKVDKIKIRIKEYFNCDRNTDRLNIKKIVKSRCILTFLFLLYEV